MKSSIIRPEDNPQIEIIETISTNNNSASPPAWLIILTFWAYLRATQPQPRPEIDCLKLVIWAVTVILVVLILTTLGGAEHVANVLSHLPPMLP
jgi:hypothetical protein